MADIFVLWDKHNEVAVSKHVTNGDALVAQRRHLAKSGHRSVVPADYVILTVAKK